MMNHNPTLLTSDQLAIAPSNVILSAIYEYIVAATSLFFALVIIYWIIRFLQWFLPKYWYRSKHNESKN